MSEFGMAAFDARLEPGMRGETFNRGGIDDTTQHKPEAFIVSNNQNLTSLVEFRLRHFQTSCSFLWFHDSFHLFCYILFGSTKTARRHCLDEPCSNEQRIHQTFMHDIPAYCLMH